MRSFDCCKLKREHNETPLESKYSKSVFVTSAEAERELRFYPVEILHFKARKKPRRRRLCDLFPKALWWVDNKGCSRTRVSSDSLSCDFAAHHVAILCKQQCGCLSMPPKTEKKYFVNVVKHTQHKMYCCNHFEVYNSVTSSIFTSHHHLSALEPIHHPERKPHSP